MVEERLAGDVGDPQARLLLAEVMSDGLHQMGLAEPHAAIEEERVVALRRLPGDGLASGMREAVGGPDDERLEGETRVERRTGEIDAAPLFVGEQGRRRRHGRRQGRLPRRLDHPKLDLHRFAMASLSAWRIRARSAGYHLLDNGFGTANGPPPCVTPAAPRRRSTDRRPARLTSAARASQSAMPGASQIPAMGRYRRLPPLRKGPPRLAGEQHDGIAGHGYPSVSTPPEKSRFCCGGGPI